MSDADAPDDDFDDFGEGDGDDDFGDLEDIGDIELGDDDFDDFGVLDDGEMNLEEIDDGEDAWRFDDTKLDDLEDFLRQVFSLEPPPLRTHTPICLEITGEFASDLLFLWQVESQDAPPEEAAAAAAAPGGKVRAPGMNNNILQLIKDVNNELADAQREVHPFHSHAATSNLPSREFSLIC